MTIFKKIKDNYKNELDEITIEEYLKLCKTDPSVYASPHQRILDAIGDPEIIDTNNDPQLKRIFSGKKIKRYPAFSDFYGMEETIEQIVNFFKHGSQGLEEKKQVLYLLGPVGGGKSSLAERLKSLMESTYFYALKHSNGEISPVYESPLGLFSEYKDDLLKEYNIPVRYIPNCMSPWAIKRLQESKGDISTFKVVKLKLSIQQQIGIAKTEPGDENNQDITSLVGKVELRKLDRFSQGDPDAYSFSGALCRANQGLMEFVEMFKSPIKMLHPLLTATQEGNYMGSEAISAIPFNGIIIAHSNESEWEKFSSDKKNEAFLDRINLIRVPYCLRLDEEIKIYKKLIDHSELSENPLAPKTLELLSTFTILTRIKKPENSTPYSKLRVYNGENLKEIDTQAKSLEEYKDYAGITEGMAGISTRFAFKVLSKVFNYDQEEIGANPIHLFYILDREIRRLQLPSEKEGEYLKIIDSDLKTKYLEFLTDEIQKAYVDSYEEYGQNLFDKYIVYADNWISDQDYIDPNTGEKYNKENLNQELEKIEKPAGITNPKDFRNDIVTYYYRVKSKDGKAPKWNSYEKIKSVLEKKIFSATEDILPVISYGDKKSKEEKKDHDNFVKRMKKRGYTERQIRLLVDWYLRVRQKN